MPWQLALRNITLMLGLLGCSVVRQLQVVQKRQKFAHHHCVFKSVAQRLKGCLRVSCFARHHFHACFAEVASADVALRYVKHFSSKAQQPL